MAIAISIPPKAPLIIPIKIDSFSVNGRSKNLFINQNPMPPINAQPNPNITDKKLLKPAPYDRLYKPTVTEIESKPILIKEKK